MEWLKSPVVMPDDACFFHICWARNTDNDQASCIVRFCITKWCLVDDGIPGGP